MSDDEFVDRFRLRKASMLTLLDEIRNQLPAAVDRRGKGSLFFFNKLFSVCHTAVLKVIGNPVQWYTFVNPSAMSVLMLLEELRNPFLSTTDKRLKCLLFHYNQLLLSIVQLLK